LKTIHGNWVKAATLAFIPAVIVRTKRKLVGIRQGIIRSLIFGKVSSAVSFHVLVKHGDMAKKTMVPEKHSSKLQSTTAWKQSILVSSHFQVEIEAVEQIKRKH